MRPRTGGNRGEESFTAWFIALCRPQQPELGTGGSREHPDPRSGPWGGGDAPVHVTRRRAGTAPVSRLYSEHIHVWIPGDARGQSGTSGSWGRAPLPGHLRREAAPGQGAEPSDASSSPGRCLPPPWCPLPLREPLRPALPWKPPSVPTARLPLSTARHGVN